MRLKGVVAAGGNGSRMAPINRALNKHLLPVYDKPMIYYPIHTLMLAGVRELLIVVSRGDLAPYRRLLGDGAQWGVRIEYAVQEQARGIAEVLLIAESFTSDGPYALALGDNLFYGSHLAQRLRRLATRSEGAAILGCFSSDPSQYAVAQLSAQGAVVGLEEKPTQPRSGWAVTGLYVYDACAARFARALRPSRRAELEITDVNRHYLEQGALHFERLSREDHWFDAGTPESLLAAANFVRQTQAQDRTLVGCPAWAAAQAGWIDVEQLQRFARPLSHTGYGRRLLQLAEQGSNPGDDPWAP